MLAMTSTTGPLIDRQRLGEPAIGSLAALDKLVDDLGSLEDAVGVVRTFAATLSWRASRIERSIVDGTPQSAIAVIQDLRNASTMVGAERLGQWCRLALSAPHLLDDASEIVDVAAATHSWLETWLDEQDDAAG